VTRRKPIGGPPPGHRDHVFDIAFSPDGKALATACKDGTVQPGRIIR
jgi:WD40 repeat protein